MKMRKPLLFLLALMLLSLSSCTTYRRIAYLKDMEVGVEYNALEAPEPTIHENDKLKILVTAQNPSLAAPFNMETGGRYAVSEDGVVASSTSFDNMKSYKVGGDGCINFPVLGRVMVEGLTLEQMKSKLENLIVESGYVKEPIVLASFQNFQILMIGELQSTVLEVEDGTINIFEALAKTRDITNNGVRNDVRVIRTIDGKKVAYSIDLQSVSCFESPAFYLQQNDMVYVKPRKVAFDDVTTSGWFTILTTTITILTSLSAIYFFLK